MICVPTRLLWYLDFYSQYAHFIFILLPRKKFFKALIQNQLFIYSYIHQVEYY